MFEDISGKNADVVERFASLCEEKEEIEVKLNNPEITEEERRKLVFCLSNLKREMQALMVKLS